MWKSSEYNYSEHYDSTWKRTFLSMFCSQVYKSLTDNTSNYFWKLASL